MSNLSFSDDVRLGWADDQLYNLSYNQSDSIQLLNSRSEIEEFLENGTSSSNQTNITINVENEIILFLMRVRWTTFIASGAVITGGMLCNILSIAVLLTSVSLRKTTTGHYLIALMFADTGFLFGELLQWMNYQVTYGTKIISAFMHTNDAACKFVHYARYSSKLVSAWITVAITFERFLTITIPLKVGTISTPFKAKIAIFSITILCLLLTSYPFWTVSVIAWKTTHFCLTLDNSGYDLWNFVVLWCGSLFLPASIIFILTVKILITLYRNSSARNALGANAERTRSIQKQLTTILVAVAIAFLLLRIPYAVVWYIVRKKDEWNIPEKHHHHIVAANYVFAVIATANYATNFFLFCLCGSSFREQLKRLCDVRRLGREKNSSSNGTSGRSHITPLSGSRSSLYLHSLGNRGRRPDEAQCLQVNGQTQLSIPKLASPTSTTSELIVSDGEIKLYAPDEKVTLCDTHGGDESKYE